MHRLTIRRSFLSITCTYFTWTKLKILVKYRINSGHAAPSAQPSCGGHFFGRFSLSESRGWRRRNHSLKLNRKGSKEGVEWVILDGQIVRPRPFTMWNDKFPDLLAFHQNSIVWTNISVFSIWFKAFCYFEKVSLSIPELSLPVWIVVDRFVSGSIKPVIVRKALENLLNSD